MFDADAEVVRQLFAREIPEVMAGIVEIKAVAREAGYLSKVLLASSQEGTDPVAVCVGARANRIRPIVEALGGERIDLIRWSDEVEPLLRSALQPAHLTAIVIDGAQGRATVFLEKDQSPLLWGQAGLNHRLTEQLCGYKIVVETIDSR